MLGCLSRPSRCGSSFRAHDHRSSAMNLSSPAAFALAVLILSLPAASAQVPEAIAAPGETLVATIHAEGAQIYECKADAAGKLAWQFREPIATLLVDGKTVGRHYAGPNWELTDGSAVVGKVAILAAALVRKRKSSLFARLCHVGHCRRLFVRLIPLVAGRVALQCDFLAVLGHDQSIADAVVAGGLSWLNT